MARALRVSRPHLSSSLQGSPPSLRREKPSDGELLGRIRAIAKERPTYGYRRVTARLNAESTNEGRVNHKRVYRVMRKAGLLLPKYGKRPVRLHEGKVITLKSNLRWCSDMFEIRCWDGGKVHVAFSLDCCDREVLSFVASDRHLDGQDVRDLMAESIERRFHATQTPHVVQWLSDNGPPYTANETRAFATRHGLIPCNTPAYSPESNGMAEAFVKTFKRDYVYLADVTTADQVLARLPSWFEDYNEVHPHKGLRMMSPRQFRKQNHA